jgi:microcystin-dependent protein
MALPFYNWSRTAASNATADSTVNWAEGQAPSSVNDSGRAMMASTAAFRDDISGAIVTGGTSTNYTVSSYQVFDTLAHMSGQMIAFTPHTTSGAGGVNLNVDGLGLKPLYTAPGVALPTGFLIEGTPYVALYNNSDAAFYLHGVFGNPYSVPIAGGIDYWGTTAPNSSFAFPAGQAISRTTYSVLFGIMSTTYGVGDGSTTFNLPDKTGRVSAMKESSATRLTATYFGASGATMGSVGGSESHTLTTAQLAAHSHGVTDPGHTHALSNATNLLDNASGNNFQGAAFLGNARNPTVNSNTTGISINNAGSGNAHNNVQPTIICNYIIRII